MAEVLSFSNHFKEMDDAKPSSLHWKIMFISGMGFFTDAYDLFIIGVVMTMLKPIKANSSGRSTTMPPNTRSRSGTAFTASPMTIGC